MARNQLTVCVRLLPSALRVLHQPWNAHNNHQPGYIPLRAHPDIKYLNLLIQFLLLFNKLLFLFIKFIFLFIKFLFLFNKLLNLFIQFLFPFIKFLILFNRYLEIFYLVLRRSSSSSRSRSTSPRATPSCVRGRRV